MFFSDVVNVSLIFYMFFSDVEVNLVVFIIVIVLMSVL